MTCIENSHDYHENVGELITQETDKKVKPGYSPSPDALPEEMEIIRPWYQKACERLLLEPRGLSGIEPKDLPGFLLPFIEGKIPLNPYREIPLVFSLKNAIEDLKRYYVQSYLTKHEGNDIPDAELDDWFWFRTSAGRLLLALDDICRTSSDRMMNVIGSRVLLANQTLQKYRTIID